MMVVLTAKYLRYVKTLLMKILMKIEIIERLFYYSSLYYYYYYITDSIFMFRNYLN